MTLKQVTKRSSKKKAKRTMTKYKYLWNGSTFRFPNSERVYVKICNAFALRDDASGKEIIPSLFDKVVICGVKKGYYPLINS